MNDLPSRVLWGLFWGGITFIAVLILLAILSALIPFTYINAWAAALFFGVVVFLIVLATGKRP